MRCTAAEKSNKIKHSKDCIVIKELMDELRRTGQQSDMFRATILPLALASAAPVGVLAARTLYTRQSTHHILLWNLFLAWIPFLLALLAWRSSRKPYLAIALGVLWLLFFPNTLYLITDLIYLRPTADTPMWWFDLVMLFSFAFVGLALGLHSLHLMHELVIRRYAPLIGWLFIFSVSVLSSFGIYIGRFLRWNSWDVFLHPVDLTSDVIASLTTLGSPLKLVTIVLLFGTLTISGLLIVPAYRATK